MNKIVDKLEKLYCMNCDGANQGCCGCTLREDIEKILKDGGYKYNECD